MALSSTGRRTFIKHLFSYSLACFTNPLSLFATPELKKEATIIHNLDNQLYVNALRSEAKAEFYKRNYSTAKSIYEKLIELFPDDIIYYDGLKKVFGATQDHLSIARLYKRGLGLNPNNVYFMERYAKSLVRMATGNEKHLFYFNEELGNENIFDIALNLYLKAIKQSPEDKFLYFGLGDALKSLERRNKTLQKSNKESVVVHDELKEKAYHVLKKFYPEWEATRNPQKGPFNKGKSIHEINFSDFIKKITEKKRRVLFFDEERQLREKNIIRMKRRFSDLKAVSEIKNQNYQQLILLGMLLLNEKDFSSNFVGLLRKSLKKNNQMVALQLFYEALYEKRKDTWTLLGKAETYRNSSLFISKALNLYLQAEKEIVPYSGKRIAAVYEGQAHCYFKLRSYQQGEQSLQKGLAFLGKHSMAVSLMIKYAEGYAMQQKYSIAIEMLKYIVDKNPEFTNSTDHALPYIYPLSSGQDEQHSTRDYSQDYLMVLYALSKMQIQRKDWAGAAETLSWIREIDPENRFAEKVTNQINSLRV